MDPSGRGKIEILRTGKQVELNEIYSKKTVKLGNGFDGDFVLFESSDFSTIEATIEDSMTAINVGLRGYHPSPDRIDWLHFHISKKSCKSFGILLASTVFSQKKTSISLTNATSQVKKIVIEPEEIKLLSGRFKVQPVSFEYLPTELNGHFLNDIPKAVPSFFFVLEEEEKYIKPDQYEERNTVYITGNHEALLFLSEFFFDMGNSDQKVSEFNLERPYGFGGVGNLSAEVRIYTEGDEEYLGKSI